MRWCTLSGVSYGRTGACLARRLVAFPLVDMVVLIAVLCKAAARRAAYFAPQAMQHPIMPGHSCN